MIGIIDYGVGNLFSLQSSFAAIGCEAVVSGEREQLRKADHLILPGVGAFEDAARQLRESGLDSFVKDAAAAGTPVMGICLGMQMLFEKSLEFGEHKGLGLLKGTVVPMAGRIDPALKIPHIGWNSLHMTKESPLFAYTPEGTHVYFVHSFFADGCEDSLIAETEYSIPITAAVQKDNVYGCQFHPEKSGAAGLEILRAFCGEVKA